MCYGHLLCIYSAMCLRWKQDAGNVNKGPSPKNWEISPIWRNAMCQSHYCSHKTPSPTNFRSWFETAEQKMVQLKANGHQRQIGFEIERLFADTATGKPITRDQSQLMHLTLASALRPGLSPQGIHLVLEEVRNGTIVKSKITGNEHHAGGILFFELGWNNWEFSTETWDLDPQSLGRTHRGPVPCLTTTLNTLRVISDTLLHIGVVDLEKPFDGFADCDTLIMPDQRDEIWLELDGDVLRVLGHIASVHINIDVFSLKEAFEFITRLNRLNECMNWPPPEVCGIWDQYIRESRAGYEPGRYGPSPETWKEYIDQISQYKLVMLKMKLESGSHLMIARPPLTKTMFQPLHDYRAQSLSEEELDLFTRSVWWWNRLRVRNNKLVLEIRAIPRGSNKDMEEHVGVVLSALDLI